MRQEFVELDGVSIPVIIDEEVRYWPISYLSEKVLLRSSDNSFITKSKRSEYADHLKKYIVEFGEKNIQECNCISDEGLKLRLLDTQQGRLDVLQRKNQNKLHNYLGIKLLSEKPLIITEIPEEELTLHNEYTIDLISSLKSIEVFQFQLCSSCEKYYPLTRKFFLKDDRNPCGFGKVCRVCGGSVKHFIHNDEDKNRIIKQAGEELFEHFTQGKLEKVYDAYHAGQINFLPQCYVNKESYLKIITYLIETNRLSEKNISFDVLMVNYGLNEIKKLNSNNINQLHQDLFGEDYWIYPWKYVNIKGRKGGHTFEEAKVVFDKYLELNNIQIKNKLEFKYGELVNNARIRLQDLLGFVVHYYDYTYAGYKFKTSGKSYYKKDENVIFDLKYLIEQDMGLEINKIPLYLTKTSLREHASPLYNHIVEKDNHNLYYWVNLIYPDVFTEMDFDINYYRDTFDSVQESQINDILVNNLSNVIYNFKRNNKRIVSIKGMQPDWIVLGEEKCWLVEYFGMYSIRGAYNSRTTDYTKKTEEKMKKYDELDGYGIVYLFPEDLTHNFEGVLEKIKIIK